MAMLHQRKALVGERECLRALFLFVTQFLRKYRFPISLVLLTGSSYSLTELIMDGTILRDKRHPPAKFLNSALEIALATQGQTEITMCQAHLRIQFDGFAQFRLGVTRLPCLQQRIAKVLM